MIKLNVSSTDEKPIYRQIEDQIRAAVLTGELKAGEALPSLRRLAAELHVSTPTVVRAYGDLAAEGVVDNIQGKGTFIVAHGDELLRRRADERIGRLMDECCDTAKAADVPLIDLMSMLVESYKRRS